MSDGRGGSGGEDEGLLVLEKVDWCARASVSPWSQGCRGTELDTYICTVCLPMGAWSRKSREMGLIHITTTRTGARKLTWSRTLRRSRQTPPVQPGAPCSLHPSAGRDPSSPTPPPPSPTTKPPRRPAATEPGWVPAPEMPAPTPSPPSPPADFTQLGQGLVGSRPESVEVRLGQAQSREGQAGTQEGAQGHQP